MATGLISEVLEVRLANVLFLDGYRVELIERGG
jgi:hypothetical protein